MSEFITFGETTAVFSPAEKGFLKYQNTFNIKCSGSESNTAIGIRKLGHSSSWMGRLGDDEIGEFVLRMLRSEGVSTDFVTIDSMHKTGIAVTQSLPLSQAATFTDDESSVFYYRDNSASSYLGQSDINESAIKKAKILHLTGITPILSAGNREVVYHAIYIAIKNNVKVSFDPNIKRKLWNYNYSGLMKELGKFSDIIILNLDEAEELYTTRSIEKLQEIILKDDEKKIVVIKDGSDGIWVIDSDEIIRLDPCLDFDSHNSVYGDAFNAGFLCGILEERTLEICGRMGVIYGAAAAQANGNYEGYLTRNQLDKILYDSTSEK